MRSESTAIRVKGRVSSDCGDNKLEFDATVDAEPVVKITVVPNLFQTLSKQRGRDSSCSEDGAL